MDILSKESTSRDVQELGSTILDQIFLRNPIAIDGSHESEIETKYTALTIALFDVYLIIQSQGNNLGAMRLKEKTIAAVRDNPWCGEPHYHRMIGYLICNHCALGLREGADRELKVYLRLIEFVTAEHSH